MNLYIIHLGYYDSDIGMYELHTNMLVAAHDLREAKQTVKSKDLFVSRKMHIDGIQEIKEIDGYHVKLEKVGGNVMQNKVYTYDDVKLF